MKIQSVEPNIADLANGWLKSYGLDYRLEQEDLDVEVDEALKKYFSKNGGVGANRPDAKLFLKDQYGARYPVLIEYKGYKDKLVKLNVNGNVDNKTSDKEPNFVNINSYAVNGAVHYANALLHHSSYTDIIAIGMTGYRDDFGQLQYSIGVYFVSKSNLGVGQKVGEFSDFSFLNKDNSDEFIQKIKELNLSVEELERIKVQREGEIDQALKKINNDIFKEEGGLGPDERVHLVAATIMATLGVPGVVRPLEKEELKCRNEIGDTDGDIIVRKIEGFLSEKNLPKDKKELIIRTLKNTLLSANINKVVDGQTQLKKVFIKIVDDLGFYYKIGLTTDFTGKLFNEMYSWLGFTQDKLNDVVLTPTYVSSLLVKLARVNKDSYVWDFATGSAGLLVAAMNEMLIDAKNSIKSPDELLQKELKIKAEQLLGLELRSSVYILAVLNMILMGDGSSNILNKDSLKDFDGKYGFGKSGEKFPADAFVLNPPYSKAGKGMIFVQKALSMMKTGYAAIIIQNSAGSGGAKEFNKDILKNNTLLASIKMPSDLFVGKAGVQTYVYVFRVGEVHHKDEMVKFIDFSNDGYTRTAKKKSSKNLRDTDNAKGRYEELVNLVRFGRSKLSIFTEKEYYESTIDPQNGCDWNQSAPVDITPTLSDFKKTVSDHLAWEVSQILQKNNEKSELGEQISPRLRKLEEDFKHSGGIFEKKKLGELFDVSTSKSTDKNKLTFVSKEQGIQFIGRTAVNNGIQGYVEKLNYEPNPKNTFSVVQIGENICQFRDADWYASQNIFLLTPKEDQAENILRVKFYVVGTINKALKIFEGGYTSYPTLAKLKSLDIVFPLHSNPEIAFDFMEKYIKALEAERLEELEAERLEELEAYLLATGLKDYHLTEKE